MRLKKCFRFSTFHFYYANRLIINY